MKYKNEVIIEKYNNKWPEIFKEESDKILSLLFEDENISRELFEINHIGSTAIAFMPAKPVIDIMLEFDNLNPIEFIKSKLEKLNYTEFSRHVIPHYSFFSRKQDGSISFHLHIRERGDPQIKRHIHFRDYLIHHVDEAKEYANIKLNLAKQFYNDRYAYTLGKDNFIQSIDRKAKIWTQRRKKFLPQNTDLKVAQSSREKLEHAIEANTIVHMTHFEQYLPIVEFKRQPKYTIVLNSVIQDDSFNYILEAEFKEENADEIISEATKQFEEKNIPYSWWVFPNDKPTNISTCLERNGFSNIHTNIGMYFDLDAWDGKTSNLENFKITQVQDVKGLKDFAFVLGNDSNYLDNYFLEISKLLTSEDPQEYYVGYLNNKPIACGLICFFGRVAGLHCLTTSPGFRKNGYGTAMQKFRLKRAKKLGFHTAILQASSSGHSLYLKLGWQELGQYKEFKRTKNNG